MMAIGERERERERGVEGGREREQKKKPFGIVCVHDRRKFFP